MPKLEVGRKLQSLSHSDVSPGLEHHHSDWPSGKSIPDDKFGDDVQADLLVGDGLDHANGDHVDEGDDKSENECPNWHLRWPEFDGEDTEGEHRKEDDGIPPFGYE